MDELRDPSNQALPEPKDDGWRPSWAAMGDGLGSTRRGYEQYHAKPKIKPKPEVRNERAEPLRDA